MDASTNVRPEGNEEPKQKSPARKNIGLTKKAHSGAERVKATPDGFILYALQNNRSMDEIRALIEMRDNEFKRLARLEFMEAKATFLKNCPEIKKNKDADFGVTKNGRQGASYRYSDLNNLIQTIKVAEGDAGLSHDWKTAYGDKGKIIITAILSHSGGHSETDTLEFTPKAEDVSDIQKMGTIISYLRRYALQNVMGLSQGGDDDDGAKAMGFEDAKVLPRPTESKFKQLVSQVSKGEVTIDELERAYSFSAEQMHSLEIAKK